MDRYQDLARELKRLSKVETKVIPIVLGALEKNLKKAESNATVELLHKAAFLGTLRILRTHTHTQPFYGSMDFVRDILRRVLDLD